MMMTSAKDRLRGEVNEPLNRPIGLVNLCPATKVFAAGIAHVGNKNSTQMSVAEETM